MKTRFYRAEIDYSQSGAKRLQMTNYLRTGPFQQVGGSFLPGRSVSRRRFFLLLIAVIILVIGLTGVL